MAKKKPDPEKEAQIADDLLIREVDDDLRAEQLHGWWQRFGSMLVGGCVTVVLATIAYQIADSYQTSKAEERTAILLEAQSYADKGQIETALSKLAPLAEEGSDAGQLAGLQAALLKQQEMQDGSSFDSIAQADDAVIRDVAKLQADKLDAIDEKSPFYSLSAEQKAIDLIQGDKKPEAKTLILSLLDRNDLPSGQRRRLNELLQGVN